MRQSHGILVGEDGVSLFYQTWSAGQPPKGIVIALHGACDHGDRFAPLAQRVAAAGYSVYAPDVRGHGRSGGRRGYINRWSEFEGDLHALLERVKSAEGEVPVFLMGHSMGGLIVLSYAIRHPEGLAGVAAICPGLTPVFPRWKVVTARLLSRVAPGLMMDPEFKLEGSSRDPAVVEAHRTDPLRLSKASIRLGTEAFDVADWLLAHAHELTVPVCLFQGGGDFLALPEGSRAFFSRLRLPDRQFREYPGGYHVPWLDTNREEFWADLNGWLAGRQQVGQPLREAP